MSKKTFNEKNIGVILNRLHQWDKTSYTIFPPQIEIDGKKKTIIVSVSSDKKVKLKIRRYL